MLHIVCGKCTFVTMYFVQECVAHRVTHAERAESENRYLDLGTRKILPHFTRSSFVCPSLFIVSMFARTEC